VSPPLVPEVHTRLRERGRGGGPNSDEATYTLVLLVRYCMYTVLCAVHQLVTFFSRSETKILSHSREILFLQTCVAKLLFIAKIATFSDNEKFFEIYEKVNVSLFLFLVI
jgi:hypothetical protein